MAWVNEKRACPISAMFRGVLTSWIDCSGSFQQPQKLSNPQQLFDSARLGLLYILGTASLITSGCGHATVLVMGRTRKQGSRQTAAVDQPSTQALALPQTVPSAAPGSVPPNDKGDQFCSPTSRLTLYWIYRKSCAPTSFWSICQGHRRVRKDASYF